jgi:hypothetical protein
MGAMQQNGYYSICVRNLFYIELISLFGKIYYIFADWSQLKT